MTEPLVAVAMVALGVVVGLLAGSALAGAQIQRVLEREVTRGTISRDDMARIVARMRGPRR